MAKQRTINLVEEQGLEIFLNLEVKNQERIMKQAGEPQKDFKILEQKIIMRTESSKSKHCFMSYFSTCMYVCTFITTTISLVSKGNAVCTFTKLVIFILHIQI